MKKKVAPPKIIKCNRRECEYYPTWQEASQAAIGLGFSGQCAYRAGYKSDKRLPSSPSVIYPDFPGWRIFLNNSFYKTWQEASRAAINLGIVSFRGYLRLYFKDPMLPSSPYKAYPDFPGTAVFLGKANK